MDLTNTIKQFIFTIIVNNNENMAIRNTDSLIESGIIDSLAIMKLLTFMEKKFSIQISSNDLMPENFESIESISKMVANKLN